MRQKLTYVEEHKVRVYIGSRHVGNIRSLRNRDGTVSWCYFAKGDRFGGDEFKSLEACKKSLEED